MKYAALLLFALLLFARMQAQSPPEINAVTELSLGHHGHSSRDELLQMAKDPEGNLLLLGFVEGDSIFADVSLQKISPEGSMLWDYRYDSPGNNNYDIPLKMSVDAAGSTTILGLSTGMTSYFLPQLSHGYLLKVGGDGQPLWQVVFDTLLPPHASGLYTDGFMDSLGHFFVTYSAFTEFGERPTYFLEFGPDGTLLQSFTRYNIVQAAGGGPAALGQAIDSSGNFVFIQWDENASPQHAIRKINAQSGMEQGAPFNPDNLSSAELINYTYMTWENIWTDEYGAIFSANNLGFPIGPTFYLSKVSPNGSVNYIMKPDSLNAHFTSLETWRGFAYITGSYIPQGSQNSVAFVWKITGEGQREYEVIASTAHDCVPRFFDLVDGVLYWATADVVTGQISLKALNTGDLSVLWDFGLHQNPDYLYTGSNIINLPGGKLSIGGTLHREKQPGSSYLSEEEFYVETFLPVENELYSQYQMSATGTTHTESIGLAVDPAGNNWVRTGEVDGPEYYLIQYAPRKYYYHLFTSDWTPVWQFESRYPAYLNFGLSPFYFDGAGNAYTVEIWGQDSLLLQKISPEGNYLHAYPIIGAGVHQVFVDRQGGVHLSLVAGNGTRTSIALDTAFQPMQPVITGLLPVLKFQLPADEAVYYYMQDEGTDPGEQTVRILLFQDGQQLWERSFPFNFSTQPFSLFDVDVSTGALLAASFWSNSAGFSEPALHRFSIDNTYSTGIINNGVFEGVFDLELMPNGNAYVAYENRLELYDAAAQLVTTIPINNAPSGGYFFQAGPLYYRAHHGTLEAYSQTGFPAFLVNNNSFTIDPAQIYVDSARYITTASTFGETLGLGYAFGWRWLQGRIRVFDLSQYPLSDAVEPVVPGAIAITYQPNPTRYSLEIGMDALKGHAVQLTLTSALGQQVVRREYQPLMQPSVQLDVSHLPAGTYLLSVLAEGKISAGKVVIAPR